MDVAAEASQQRSWGDVEPAIIQKAHGSALADAVRVSGSVVRLPSVRYRWDRCLLRRALDVVGAAVGLLITLPLWPVIAVLIKLSSRGPVFIRQMRGGYKEDPFVMYKFRSMTCDGSRARQRSSATRKDECVHAVTRVGRILRGTSLDELPQLLSVLSGDMSLIGPRPLIFPDLKDPHKLASPAGRVRPEDLILWRYCRCQVRPGITGLWQVSGRSSLPLEGWLSYDVAYVTGCSPKLDLAILLRTVGAVVGGRGAR